MSSTLAPYAASDAQSRGRFYEERSPKFRSQFQRDRDRIVHSGAFRRLEYKTQVFVNHEGDMFRTRLTHSIEVAQIGRAIARELQLNEDLTEAISLAHDLGHTPFGHAGQDALNLCMGEYGGFEHNLQSLRVVEELEERYAAFNGLNLTFESREGILKHCSLANAKKLGAVGERFINRGNPTLEAQIADMADTIAYNNHDIDDGLRGGFLTINQLLGEPLFEEQFEEVQRQYPGLDSRRQIHEIIRRMINRQVTDLLSTSRQRLADAAPASVDEVRTQERPLIGFSEEMLGLHTRLKRFLGKNLYRHYRVHRMSLKAQRTIQSLFEALFSDTRLLPPEHQKRVEVCSERRGERGRARAVADYIAGMTDRFAISEYRKLYHPEELT
ncbi:MAG: deoxyguanosinetriphosphate triphosphohydrolase [Gammaproteobacteria bacterium]|nr:deoxyguanosinetriphosphate triphosphohydrolase [Gammaproteobacteria bacterium]